MYTNKELFGVFGDRDEFEQLRSDQAFDIVDGEYGTVGIRDPHLGVPGRSTAYTGENGACVVWGEAYVPESEATNAAQWMLHQYANRGMDAFSALNGSYLAFIEYDGDARLITDPIRTWECFYTDVSGVACSGPTQRRSLRSSTDRRFGTVHSPSSCTSAPSSAIGRCSPE